MKKFTYILAAGLALAGTALSVRADILGLASGLPAINGFAASSTNQATTLSWAVVTARSGNNGTPVVTFVAAGSDLATAKVSTYKVTAQCKVNFTNSTVTLFVNNTNGFGSAASDVIVIRHLQNDWYEKRILTANSDTTNLVVTVAPTQAVIPGDIVYRCTTTGAASYLQTAVTNTLSAPGGIFVGQQGLPLLVEVNATTAGAISTVSGYFLPPVAVPRPGL